ncbi:MAG: hypothetical protein HQL99_10050 [Magnetococcales bacterium]|nr:hypothetical protein [Magnetococcales bacterium]
MIFKGGIPAGLANGDNGSNSLWNGAAHGNVSMAVGLWSWLWLSIALLAILCNNEVVFVRNFIGFLP